MAQQANWNTIRTISSDLAGRVQNFDSDIEKVWLESNGFSLVFKDGSRVAFIPSITRDADPKEGS